MRFAFRALISFTMLFAAGGFCELVAQNPPDTFHFPPGVLQPQDSVLRERLKKAQSSKPTTPVKPVEIRRRLSIVDSIVGRFSAPMLSLDTQQRAGYARQPGEIVRRHSELFQLDFKDTPYRSTIQPYGLPGDRLGVISGGNPITSWELLPEPDGARDLYAAPIASAHTNKLLPAGLGHIAGGSGAATLWGEPIRSEKFEPRSRFESDQGTFGYDFTRGSFAKSFTSGREIDFGIGYTTADGTNLGSTFASYSYNGTLTTPIGSRDGLIFRGHLYDVEGRYQTRPNIGASVLSRKSFDRSFTAGWERHSPDRTARRSILYQYGRHSSNGTGAIKTRDNLFSDGLRVESEHVGMLFTSLHADLTSESYDNGFEKHRRLTGQLGLLVSTRSTFPASVRAELSIVESVGLLPSLSIAHRRRFANGELLLTTSAQSGAPSLRHWFLPDQTALLLSSSHLYRQSGNPGLKPELLLIGTADWSIGTPTDGLGLSLGGGTITDAIVWKQTNLFDDESFVPANIGIAFATVAARGQLTLFRFLRLFGSGSYFAVDRDDTNAPLYQPDYQSAVGGELHYRWESKRIDLFAYGELISTGPYDGYSGRPLGQTAVANSKLTMQMGNFNFHWAVANILNLLYEPREFDVVTGRTNWWGISWLFTD